MSSQVLLELAELEMEGRFPNTREWVLDQMVPYCEGIRAAAHGD